MVDVTEADKAALREYMIERARLTFDGSTAPHADLLLQTLAKHRLAHTKLPDDVAGLVERTNERLGGVSSPLMEGDNISILLCGYFDDPDADEQDHDDCGWSEAAVTGCNQVLDAIREHYAPLADTITALAAEVERLRAIERPAP